MIRIPQQQQEREGWGGSVWLKVWWYCLLSSFYFLFLQSYLLLWLGGVVENVVMVWSINKYTSLSKPTPSRRTREASRQAGKEWKRATESGSRGLKNWEREKVWDDDGDGDESGSSNRLILSGAGGVWWRGRRWEKRKCGIQRQPIQILYDDYCWCCPASYFLPSSLSSLPLGSRWWGYWCVCVWDGEGFCLWPEGERESSEE